MLPGDRMLRSGGSVAAQLPRGQHVCGSAVWPSARAPPAAAALKEKHLFSLAWHREGAILLLLMLPAPECFHFVFADGRCPLSSSEHQPGAGGGESHVHPVHPFP